MQRKRVRPVEVIKGGKKAEGGLQAVKKDVKKTDGRGTERVACRRERGKQFQKKPRRRW